MKKVLIDLVDEKSISEVRGIFGLIIIVLLKYGIAPLASI